jgi:hypothetical protein
LLASASSAKKMADFRHLQLASDLLIGLAGSGLEKQSGF